MNLHLNPYVRALVGGISAALIVATPLVDDGVTVSEWLAIAGALMSGSGLTAVAPAGKASQDA